MKRITQGLAAVSVIALAGATAACGGGGSSAAGSDSGDPLVVAMSWPYEPWQVGDGTATKDGIEPELITAIAKEAGLDIEIQNVDFTGIITGTQAGKYDIAMSGLGIYGDRLNALAFIPDAKTGYTMLVNKEDAGRYQTLDDLCGVKVALGNGTKNAIDVAVANGTDEGDGDEDYAGVCKDDPIQVSAFDDQAGQDLAFSTGKVEAQLLTQQVAESYAKKSGGRYVAAPPYDTVNFGIGIPKDETELADQLVEAFHAVVEDGTYAQILKKYGESDAALPVEEIEVVNE